MALLRPSCLYCGAALASHALGAATPSEAGPQAPPRDSRVLLFLDLTGADPRRLAERLGISHYEARQRLVRGGFQLHRVLPPEAADAEATRLDGLRVVSVPASEIEPALRPVPARGGALVAGRLELRGPDGPLRIGAEHVLGLVRGPIAREYAAAESRRRALDSARLEPGYRFQIHRQREGPVELDPWAFEFPDRDVGRSSLLTLTEWVLAVVRDRPQDDGFRHASPALAPAEEPQDEARRAMGRGERPAGAPAVLDNLRQFRIYSGGRAALMRRGM